jgi:chromosome segregation ATPase
MATVKNLEERTFEMSEDIAIIRSTVAVLASKMDAMQGQLASALVAIQANQTHIALLLQKSDATATRLDQVEARLVAKVEQGEQKLDARIGQTDKQLEGLTTSYTAFEARGELTNKFLKWLGGLAAVAILALVGSAVTVARSAGHLEADVKALQESTAKMERDIADIKVKLK